MDLTAEMAALRAEAADYGVVLTGTTLADLREQLRDLRQRRGGMPACFGRLFSPVARECAVCEVALSCAPASGADPTGVTSSMSRPPEPLQCPRCLAGTLSVALTDPATGGVLDWGCSCPECPETLVSARAWTVPRPVAKPRPKGGKARGRARETG